MKNIKEVVDFIKSKVQAEVEVFEVGNEILKPEKYEEIVFSNTTWFHEEEAKDFDIKNAVYVGVQYSITDDTCNTIMKSTPFKEINKYMYVLVNKAYQNTNDKYRIIVKVNHNILAAFEIDEEELWKYANENTKKEIEFQTFGGMPILSNKSDILGASSILYDCFYEKLSETYHSNKILVMPSSIHEVIVLNYNDNIDMANYYSKFVYEVNREQVNPKEWLADHAYVVDTNDWTTEMIPY